MGGIFLEYQGRGFWSKYLIHDLVYLLCYQIEQLAEAPLWAKTWVSTWKAFGLDINMPDFMFGGVFEPIVSQEQLDFMVEQINELLEYLKNYQAGLQEDNSKIRSEKEKIHYERLKSLQPSSVLSSFCKLCIKQLTSIGWYEAYHSTYARPDLVAIVDYLEAIKPNGVIGCNSLFRGLYDGGYWISANNPKFDPNYPDYAWRSPKETIPDLVVSPGQVLDLDEIDFDDYQFQNSEELSRARENQLTEVWRVDTKRMKTLFIHTLGEGIVQTYSSEADFYSPTLKKTVNLKSIYEV